MARLNETITIKSAEYRPCTVAGKRALFHKWEENSEIYAPSPMVGGHNGGVVKYTLAIVEFEDGHVERVRPQDIMFIDNYFHEFDFTDNQEGTPTNTQKSPKFIEKKMNCPYCEGREHSFIFYDINEKEYFAYCKACGIEKVETYKTEARALKAFLEGKTKKIVEGNGKKE